MHYWYSAYAPPAGVDVPPHLLNNLDYFEIPTRDADGEYLLDIINVQDVMAWETQGPIAQRQLEKLGTTDVGVIHFRNMLKRELANVAAGKDPMGTVRDPAKNTVIQFALERNKAHYADSLERGFRHSPAKYSALADDICAVFAAFSKEPVAAG